MSTANYDPVPSDCHPATVAAEVPRPRHRLREVRLQQGVSLRSVARQTGSDVRTLRAEEEETSDLRLSDLQKWQQVLEVPISDLLVECDASLSRPVLERARMIRIMKTAAAILEQAPTPGVVRMAQTLVEQLQEIMPELAQVNAWHTFGQRRSLEEYGRVIERRISEELFHCSWDDD